MLWLNFVLNDRVYLLIDLPVHAVSPIPIDVIN